MVMRREQNGFVVPLPKELKVGTLAGILRQVGVSAAEFIDVL